MKIGIIGASTVGITLATRFVALGYPVLVANSRGRESLTGRLQEIDSGLIAASVAEVCLCDVVFLAVPWIRISEILTEDIDWGGRVLVDTTNIFLSYAPDFQIDNLNGDSGSEIVSRLAPSAQTVKAFNTLPFDKVFAPHDSKLKRVLFLAGDNNSAVDIVEKLIIELELCPITLGTLATGGRLMELGGALNGVELLSHCRH